MSIEIGIIGVGWCGGIRAITAADNPQISKLHICDIKADRLDEVVKLSKPASFTTDSHRTTYPYRRRTSAPGDSRWNPFGGFSAKSSRSIKNDWPKGTARDPVFGTS